MTITSLSTYDRNAYDEIQKYLHPEESFLDKALKTVNKPLEYVGDLVMDNQVGEAIAGAIKGIMTLLNDGASWTVRNDAIYEEFQDDGYKHVRSADGVRGLTLEQVDKVVGYMPTKYKTIAAAEGFGTGLAGAAGIAADIPLLLGLNLRGIGEHAVYYGYSVDTPAEREFMLHVLMLTSSPTQAAKQATLIQLNKIAIEVAKKKTWKELEKHVIVRGLQEMAKQLGIRLTKAKLGQVVPVMGSVIAGGYNAWYTHSTMTAAGVLYRRRFLGEKYGLELIKD